MAMPKTAKKNKPQRPAEIRNLADLRPDSRNANKGTERGSGLIEHSLRQFGAGRSVLADKHGRLIAGNKTVEGCINAGLEKVRVVQTDGTELVVVQRTDLDLETDRAARELAIVDNRASQVSLAWDAAQLESLAKDYDIDLNSLGISDEEMAKLAGKAATDDAGAGHSIGERYEVVVECASESEQREVFERLTADGLTCRVLTI